MAVLCKLTGHALPYRCGDCRGYCIEQVGMTVTRSALPRSPKFPPALRPKPASAQWTKRPRARGWHGIENVNAPAADDNTRRSVRFLPPRKPADGARQGVTPAGTADIGNGSEVPAASRQRPPCGAVPGPLVRPPSPAGT